MTEIGVGKVTGSLSEEPVTINELKSGYDTFMVPENSDPQNALIFVFLPVYAAVAAGLLGTALWVLQIFLGRRST